MRVSYLILLSVALLGCTGAVTQNNLATDLRSSIEVKYAKGFSVSETERGVKLTIQRPFPGASKPVVYHLVENQQKRSSRTIHVPVSSIVCTSTSHIAMIEYLGIDSLVVGFPSPDYISSKSLRKRIDSGLVVDIGNSQDLNLEKLLELSPEVVINYSMEDLRATERLESFGLQVVLNGDYLENHPLGRAEWIKVFGLLTNTSDRADSIFNHIENEYLTTRAINSTLDHCAFSGSLYGDTWFMPGGNNYAAQLLKDAGFDYLLAADSTNGFLQWGFENVFEAAKDCEFWLSPAPFATLRDLKEADTRYAAFTSFQRGNVYVYDNKKGATGGNEYLELGYMRPDIILKDLVKIADPRALPNHELYFYRKLTP